MKRKAEIISMYSFINLISLKYVKTTTAHSFLGYNEFDSRWMGSQTEMMFPRFCSDIIYEQGRPGSERKLLQSICD